MKELFFVQKGSSLGVSSPDNQRRLLLIRVSYFWCNVDNGFNACELKELKFIVKSSPVTFNQKLGCVKLLGKQSSAI